MKRRPAIACPLLLALLLALLPAATIDAQGPIYADPTERFGVDVVQDLGTISLYDVAPLRLSWYTDWDTHLAPERPGGIEYVHLITAAGGQIVPESYIRSLVQANPPGSLWIIGNEPECPHQDRCTPEEYAILYQHAYVTIKSYDPTAQVAVGGVVEGTPLRLKWLTRMVDYYQATFGEPLPVDVWNTHNIILPESGDWGAGVPVGLGEGHGELYGAQDNDNMDIWRRHIVNMRVWMRDHGYRDKPLIVSEYGVLMPTEFGFTPERINAFMNASFDYMMSARDDTLGYPADGNRLVQRWAWNNLNGQPYDFRTGRGVNGALFDYLTCQITAAGTNYQRYTDALAGGQICLSGSITLTNRLSRPLLSYAIPVTVTLTPAGGGEPITRTTHTDTLGHFGVCQVPPGTYSIRVKGFNTLAIRFDGVTLAADTPLLDFGSPPPGDANGDNIVNILDFALLSRSFWKSAGQDGFDARADFNGDGTINILDFALLSRNFWKQGVQ